MSADIPIDVATLAPVRALTVTEYAIEIAEQLHAGHEFAWSVSTGKVSAGVMTMLCLTCKEEDAYALESRRRRLDVTGDRVYGPKSGPKWGRRRF
jgi:hypothetical protein